MAFGKKEILQGRPGEARVKLSEAEKTYKMKVPENLIEEFGDVLVSKRETEKILSGKLSVEELSKLKREQLKNNVRNNGNIEVKKVSNAIGRSNEIEKKGDQEQKESKEAADKKFDSAINKITKGNPKVTNALKKTKQINKNVVEKTKELSEGFSWEKLEKLPVIGGLFRFLAAFLGGILGIGKGFTSLFNFGEKAKEKLSSKEIQKTKKEVSEKIKTDLLDKFGKIHPVLKQKLEEKVDDPDFISGENIRELKEISDKNGKLEIRDIKYVLTEEEYIKIGEEIKKDPEVYEAMKLKYEAEIIDAVSKEYGINLEGDKKEELKKLIQEKGAAEKIDILEFYTRVENGETITLGELTVGLFDEAVEATWFTMSLFSKGIIAADNFIFNIVEGGTKLAFGLAGFGLQKLDLKDFTGSLEKMNEKEKILVLGLLYRKGGTLFELLGSITGFATTQLIESLSTSPVNKWELYRASSTKDINKKIKAFEKVEKILGGKEGTDILQATLEKQKIINKNNRIIGVIREVEQLKDIDEASRVGKLRSLLKSKNLYTENLDGIGTFKEIRKILGEKVVTETSFTTREKIKGYFWKDIEARKIELSRNVDAITSYQSKVISGEGKVWRGLSKVKQSFHSVQIGKNAERVLLEAKAGKIGDKTAKGVITKLEALKKLSLEAPDLCRAILRGLPEIAVMGLAAGTREENESIMEAMIKVAPFLTRIVGPGMMIISLGAAYREGKVKWVNVAEAGLGTVFLGLDAAAAVKIFGEHGFSGKSALEIGKFIVKPVTAPIDVAVRGANFGRSAIQLARAKGSSKEVIKEIGKKTLTKIKNIRGRNLAMIIGIGAIGGYAIKEIFDEDFDEKYEALVNEGIVDGRTGEIKDMKRAKETFQGLDQQDKQAFVEIMFMTHKSRLIDSGYLNFEIPKGNNLIVSTEKNKSIGEWVITPEIEVELKELGIKNIDFQNNTPEK